MKKTNKSDLVVKGFKSYGGRATAVGVGYEAQVAAMIASKMLTGKCSLIWEGIDGEDIEAIIMQDVQPVDDVVVALRGDFQFKVFISAKHRAGTISITEKSPPFIEVISSFVRQFHQLATMERAGSRLMWAVPSSAGVGMTQVLRKSLDVFRQDACESINDFLKRRSSKEQGVMNVLFKQIKSEWKSVTKKIPDETELREIIRMIYVEVFDFGSGFHHELSAEGTIRSSLAENQTDSRRIWEKLELHFSQANRQGLRTTASSLRQLLVSAGLKLKTMSGFAADVEYLKRLTTRNIERLKDHTLLRFAKEEVHIARREELVEMTAAAKNGHLLVTGEPGCGKSGLIYTLASELSIQGIPVVLLLAEEVFGNDGRSTDTLPGLTNALDDVFSNWPDGTKGVFITDALDAVRDDRTQRFLRRLLQDVQKGASGWTVVASVREFDLKYGRELRECFPGDGIVGYCSKEFSGISHFHVKGLSDSNLDNLVKDASEIAPFILSARQNPRACGIHRSPFFLRLAADLLKNGVRAARLADWSSPAILLRCFWKERVLTSTGAGHRKSALQSICRSMKELRSMTISVQEVSLDASEQDAIEQLRSRGILQSPVLQHGSPAGEDQLRFSHHLLHDYAIARTLIPAGSERFSEFAGQNPLLPVFYRQSFLFALEELWDGPDGRDGFWACAIKMEDVAPLHGITRILAPLLAARRVDTFADLSPLFAAVERATSEDSPAEKALRHFASGLQDADEAAVLNGTGAWCVFVEKLSELLLARNSLETPIVHILVRLNTVSDTFTTTELRQLNLASRRLLVHYLSKDVARGWRYASLTAIETICRTFAVDAADSEAALLSLLTPKRLVQFPHHDLFDLARHLKHLDGSGDIIVLRLFEAAFASEPNPGEWENLGGAIMPLRMQSSDNWNSIHFSLADYYESNTDSDAALMTEIACIAWNAVVRRREGRCDLKGNLIATFRFRGLECELYSDYGRFLDREHEHEENRILCHFETLLDGWAKLGDTKTLGRALDILVSRNRSSLLWSVFMEKGAKYPASLGRELVPLLRESQFFTHSDYSYGANVLFAALHKTGDNKKREKLEKLILDLPKRALSSRKKILESDADGIVFAQSIMLGVLDESNIILSEVRELRDQMSQQEPLPANSKPQGIRVTSVSFSDKEELERRGLSLKDPVNTKIFRLREALKPFRELEDREKIADTIDRNWSVIGQCERFLQGDRSKQREMSEELWGYLVGACEKIVSNVSWPSSDPRWKLLRRILLKASNDPLPNASKNVKSKDDDLISWNWPAPRIDAVRGLLHLVYRLGYTDKQSKSVLLRLCSDKSLPLRLNMGDRLALLEYADPALMWQLFDYFIRFERNFTVLDAIVSGLDHLWENFANEVKLRLSRIAKRVVNRAPVDHHIHKQLTHAHLFHYLRTGDIESECFITALITDCDSARACSALTSQLHTCRVGKWLTAGDAVSIVEFEESVRKRAWTFFRNLLSSAQSKLQHHRQLWQKMHAEGNTKDEDANCTQDAIKRMNGLVDYIASQLYFASGALVDKVVKGDGYLTEPQLRRYWSESSCLFQALAVEINPHTAHQIVEALNHLLPCAPREVFMIAANSIISSSSVGYQHDSIAAGDVVKLIQHALADHREIFKSNGASESECLVALLQILDLFVEAGWSQARQLTHRLEEIYR